ncbi:MAG: HD domain-containing protein, partial [Lachnospiraceae bacterium]|nr:HD domain-containing protein [Lachnospiraceae bacterium]
MLDQAVCILLINLGDTSQKSFEWYEKAIENELKITKGDITAMATVRYIRSENRNVGYLVEMRDVSSHLRYLENLEGNRHYLELEVEKKATKIVHIQDSIITGIASMVESRDNSTGDHIRRTSEGVRIFVEQIKKHKSYDYLGESFCINMIKAAPMHDLGKIVIPDAILNKPGRFTDEEFEIMKTHATAGGKIVHDIIGGVAEKDYVDIASDIACY